MLEKNLEILIITYDRARDLEKTLDQVLKSPFKNCKVTVIDNCSPDSTPQVCTHYQKLFSNMKIIRHKKNIGSSPNYLRAVELSDSKYTWILCDDDMFDFTDCSDVIEAIESDKYDIILVGAETQFEWERGLKTSTKDIIDKGAIYYSTLGFIPSCIFKTENYDAACIYRGYYNVQNIYPHFPFINKTVEENYSIYVSKKRIVYWGDQNLPGFPEIDIFIGWLNCCQSIKDKEIRLKAIRGSPHYNGFKGIISAIALEKLRKDGRSISQIIFPLLSAYIPAFGFSRYQLLLLIAIGLALTPSILIKDLIRVRLYLKYNMRGEEVPERLYSYIFEDDRFKRGH
ncbi:MAG: glycosyltransferase [Methanobacteriaceae archaeon]